MGDFWTNTQRYPSDVGVQYFRRTITLAQFLASADTNGVPIGKLEAGALGLPVYVYVETAFDAGTTNTLDVGFVGGTDGYAAAAGTLVGVTGVKGPLSGTATMIPQATDKQIYAKFGQTGTAATTGKVTIYMPYAVKREVEGTTFPAN